MPNPDQDLNVIDDDWKAFRAKAERIANDLEQRFLTPFGLATEDPTSQLYAPNGYWRGPIWAPTTYLLVDGVRRGGRRRWPKSPDR